MIISASRRTDIPAFYAEWLVHRLREGWCSVPNPFNRNQVSRISLRRDDVDAIVFWTRNPRPLMRHLDELDARGYRYCFQFTLLGYPPEIDPKTPPAATSVRTFRELAGRLGAGRVIWRYDPIMFTGLTPPDFHRENYRRLAEALRGCTERSVISVVDRYRKTEHRLRLLAETPAGEQDCDPAAFAELMRELGRIARANDMEIVSCAEQIDLQPYGIRPGKCVDDGLLARAFGLTVSPTKDPSQRPACGCVVSRDIGMYDSCLFGCPYCYATKSFDLARSNFEAHDPHSPCLLHQR